MPEYDRRARHATLVRADAATVAKSIERANLATSGALRLLFERCYPVNPSPERQQSALTLRALAEMGCALFRSATPHEIALGAVGILAERGLLLSAVSTESFRGFSEPRAAKMFVHFSVASADAARTVLTVETRLRCSEGPAANLLPIWDALQRHSAGARRDVLLSIKHVAETGNPALATWD